MGYFNKANSPTMRPLRFAFCDGACGNGGVGTVMVVAAAAAVAVVAALAEAMVPLRMILCLQIVCFPCFLKRRNGRTYLPTDGRTDPLIEMRGRI